MRTQTILIDTYNGTFLLNEIDIGDYLEVKNLRFNRTDMINGWAVHFYSLTLMLCNSVLRYDDCTLRTTDPSIRKLVAEYLFTEQLCFKLVKQYEKFTLIIKKI